MDGQPSQETSLVPSPDRASERNPDIRRLHRGGGVPAGKSGADCNKSKLSGDDEHPANHLGLFVCAITAVESADAQLLVARHGSEGEGQRDWAKLSNGCRTRWEAMVAVVAARTVGGMTALDQSVGHLYRT